MHFLYLQSWPNAIGTLDEKTIGDSWDTGSILDESTSTLCWGGGEEVDIKIISWQKCKVSQEIVG